MTDSPLKEEFLHYLWRTKKMPIGGYVTTDGRPLEILDFGIYNLDAGPDFFNGKIKLEDTIWAGNIEMHVFSSDWKKHKHHQDKAYDNVILHVVYEEDKTVYRSDDKPIPTLELKGKIPKLYLNNYLGLIQSQNKIPCQSLISCVKKEKINLWKYNLTVERLGNKSAFVNDIYMSTGNDWEETLYIMLARYFGSKVNTEPFEKLARSLPLNIIYKNKDKRRTLDALFFGQAGMLMANYKDAYFNGLKSEYQYQQKKYGLKPIDSVSWKFSKLRPMNFPTIRIAQFAGLMYNVQFLFSKIREAENASVIKKIIASDISEYWNTHYRFGVVTTDKAKNPGSNFIDLLLINAIAPVLFAYGKLMADESYIYKAISILEYLPSEKNNIISLWNELEIESTSAFDSQALIQLKSSYCDKFRCLYCNIGNDIMNLKED
ncbi:MAG: DUF2851 family protein [Saprospiraceae bacterium]|nr:DUF2851 family protein [Saprospiraceae bacterium]